MTNSTKPRVASPAIAKDITAGMTLVLPCMMATFPTIRISCDRPGHRHGADVHHVLHVDNVSHTYPDPTRPRYINPRHDAHTDMRERKYGWVTVDVTDEAGGHHTWQVNGDQAVGLIRPVETS